MPFEASFVLRSKEPLIPSQLPAGELGYLCPVGPAAGHQASKLRYQGLSFPGDHAVTLPLGWSMISKPTPAL